MTKRTSVINISGDHEESIVQFAKDLGLPNTLRRKLFDTVYGRGEKARSKKQIMERAEIPDIGTNAQKVQNEIDKLRKRHLIVRSENDGSVKDGSKYLYGKDETVRAYKDKIIKLADDPQKRKQTPTKRRPAIQGADSVRQVTKRALKKQKHLNVLYLTASPDSANPLRVDAETKMVQEAIQSSKYRDNITLQYRPAADLSSLTKGLNDHRPQIVHFSGHGNEDEIATDTGQLDQQTVQPLSFDLLAKALAATDSPPDVIVLNSCKSSAAKKSLLPTAKIIIAMRKSVSDIAAANFAQNFYAAIASGQSVKAAFEQGKVAVEAASISEADTPELHCASGVNPATIILT